MVIENAVCGAVAAVCSLPLATRSLGLIQPLISETSRCCGINQTVNLPANQSCSAEQRTYTRVNLHKYLLNTKMFQKKAAENPFKLERSENSPMSKCKNQTRGRFLANTLHIIGNNYLGNGYNHHIYPGNGGIGAKCSWK